MAGDTIAVLVVHGRQQAIANAGRMQPLPALPVNVPESYLAVSVILVLHVFSVGWVSSVSTVLCEDRTVNKIMDYLTLHPDQLLAHRWPAAHPNGV